MLGPGYPGEMPLFALGLADVGARVIGVGDQPVDGLPDVARRALSDYVQIPSWGDEDGAIATVLSSLRGQNVDLVESLWEPTMLMAARLREAIGVPGLDRRADRAVPRQGADEGGPRGRRHPHTARRAQHDRGGMPGGRRAGRLPVDRQADRRRRLARHLPGRRRRCARRRAGPPRPRPRGQRGGVHRRRRVHLRHGVRRRPDRLRQHLLVPAPTARRQAGRADDPAGDRPARPRRPRPGRRARPWARR